MAQYAIRIRNFEARFQTARQASARPTGRITLSANFEREKWLREFLLQPRAPELLGSLIVIALVASTCSPRGILLDPSNGPMDAGDLAFKTGMPRKKIATALELLEDARLIENVGVSLVNGRWELDRQYETAQPATAPESVITAFPPQPKSHSDNGASDMSGGASSRF